jgi:phosphoenolpyruvate-protein kinase (PTS system EI component)
VEHFAAVAPALASLRGRVATVRTLDFGADKTPPLLAGTADRGLTLMLSHPAELARQLRAILRAGMETKLRILLPLVESAEQVREVRLLIDDPAVPIGAMIETPAAAGHAAEIARQADFLSIGTNDLAHATLGTDRFGGGRAPAHDPRVLAHVAATAAAARSAGIPLEVCGEAASDAVAMPLLVGLGVGELSVGAARVATVRRWVRALDAGRARRLAARALELDGSEAVARLVAAALGGGLDEPGDELGEPVDRDARLGAVGAQP